MRPVYFLVFFSLFIELVCASEIKPDTDATPHLDEAITNLRATDSEWRRNDAEFRRIRKKGTSSETEIREFAEFVAGLKRQVFEGCQAVRELGEDPKRVVTECEILVNEQVSISQPIAQVVRALTEQEKQALHEAKLREIEARMDGMLLTKQKEIRRKRQSDSSIGGWAGTERDETTENNGARIGEQGNETRAGQDRQFTGSGGVETGSGTGQIATATEPGAGPGVKKNGGMKIGENPKTPTGGSDDDVVAQQLREVAEAETDPIMRKHLWDEYRKYKNSTK